jgi:hypothetical protein
MTKISRADIAIDRSVKRRVALPPEVDADLLAYANLLSADDDKVDPADLIATMVERFMAGDRQFRQARRFERGGRPRRAGRPDEHAVTANGHPRDQEKA